MPTTAQAPSCSVGASLARYQRPHHVSDSTVFEGDGKAALYTGDIRSEPCHVDAIIRNPCMVEYSHTQGKRGLRTLDRVYLDTSFTEDVQFQTKSDGLRKLLEKVSKYPEDTMFYLSAWTYGYEEVWIALAKALDTKVCKPQDLFDRDE